MNELIAIGISLLVVFIICLPIILHRRKISEQANEVWEEEDKTIYVRYGKYDIPILQSQQKAWDAMKPDEKWWMLEHLKQEVQGGRLTSTKENGITKFTGITNKAKDIKHRQKLRTEAWNTSPEKN